MKTAAQYLKEHSEAFAQGKVEYNLTGQGILEAMKAYAKAAIEEQLKVAAEEAKVKHKREPYIGMVWDVDKDSITNCTRIELK